MSNWISGWLTVFWPVSVIQHFKKIIIHFNFVHLSLSQTSHSSFCLQVGVSLLLVGIVALNRVRMEIPLEKENQTKLVKFMIRMGVFSVLYLVPLLTVIGCYLYEHTHRTIWETTWMEENCRHYHIPCPYKVKREGSEKMCFCDACWG